MGTLSERVYRTYTMALSDIAVHHCKKCPTRQSLIEEHGVNVFEKSTVMYSRLE